MSEIAPVTWLPELATAMPTPLAMTAEPVADFAGLLKSGVESLTDQTAHASSLLEAYAVGESVTTHEMVIAMEQARVAMQMAVEVRNRLVDAYQELTRMQI